jgi:hypothetical protein
VNTVQIYEDCLLNDNKNEVGELIIWYENLGKENKNNRGIENRRRDEMRDEVHEVQSEKKKKKSKSKPRGKIARKNEIETGGSAKKGEKQKNIGMEGSKSKAIIGSTSVIRTKRYNGGNIIIGQAARFRS